MGKLTNMMSKKPSMGASIMPGKAGGALSKVAAGPMGHPAPKKTPVKSDRGNFTIKG